MKGTRTLEQYTVLFADEFYMNEEAINSIRRIAKINFSKAHTENEMVSELQIIKPKVIVSEYFKISSRIMDASPDLKGIIVWGVGYDHIDVKAASERGIFVANTRGSNAESVAEHVFSLILGLARHIPQIDSFVRRGNWVRREETGIPREMVAQDLQGKTLGIIGLGTIGTRVAGIGKTFGMGVRAYDPYKNPEEARELGVQIVDLKSLLSESDFITLHAVLTDKTKSMIGRKELSLMKKKAFLINTSRGALIDENALIEALKSGNIAGAGLDVFREEPVSIENPLLRMSNVMLTPHVAGNSQDALDRTSLVVSQETVRVLSEGIPDNLINKKELAEGGHIG